MSRASISAGAMIVCSGKVPYETKAAALYALSKIQSGRRVRNKERFRGKIVVYECPACFCFHHSHDQGSGCKPVVREEE